MPEAPAGHDFTNAGRGERLQRVLADAGIGSRRACEELITAGEVTVNGQLVAELPAWVDPEEDRIVVQGRPVPRPERRLYVLLNKPARTLSTLADEPGADRRTVADLVDHPGASRLFPVGRLDYDSVGLVLMTNDGELANRLTHPRYGVPKTYRVVVDGVLGPEAVAELERGIYLAERKAGRTDGAKRTARVEIRVVSQNRQNTTLEMTLREGRNRQVRRMLAAVDYPVRKLERVAMGPLRLKGVARGAWRELTRDEVWALKRAAADARVEAGGGRAGEDRPQAERPARRKAKKTGTRKGAGKRGQAYEPPPLDPGEPIRRRTLKNAINRATRPEGAPARAPKADGPEQDRPPTAPERPSSKRSPGRAGPGHAERSGRGTTTERPGKPARPAKPGRAGKAGGAKAPGRPGKPGRSGDTGGSGKPGRSDKPGKPGKPGGRRKP